MRGICANWQATASSDGFVRIYEAENALDLAHWQLQHKFVVGPAPSAQSAAKSARKAQGASASDGASKAGGECVSCVGNEGRVSRARMGGRGGEEGKQAWTKNKNSSFPIVNDSTIVGGAVRRGRPPAVVSWCQSQMNRTRILFVSAE